MTPGLEGQKGCQGNGKRKWGKDTVLNPELKE